MPSRAKPDEKCVDVVLGDRVVAGELADVDDLRLQVDAVGGEPVEHRARAQAIRDDDVGSLESAEAAHGEQARIAGAGAHQPHLAGGALSVSKAHRAPAVTSRPRRFSIRRSTGPKKTELDEDADDQR